MSKVLKALFVIIGTLVGAGFASGQEIYIFFYQYGINGIAGIVASSILLAVVIYKVLNISQKEKVENYKAFLNGFIKNEKCLEVFNTVINLFILITFYIMIAGFGAYFEQEFKINGLIGSCLLAVICYVVFLRDVSGLIKVNQWIVPILIGSLLFIGMSIIDVKDIFQMQYYLPQNQSRKWLLDGILYGSYNTILLIPVLIALRNLVTNKNKQIVVSIFTGILVIILSLIISFMLMKVDVPIENLEMPAVYVASKISIVFEYIYGFIILSSILTTSVSLGTSFLENVAKTKKSYKQFAILICVSSVIVSNIGFSNLVNLLYPIFGYIGLVQIVAILKR